MKKFYLSLILLLPFLLFAQSKKKKLLWAKEKAAQEQFEQLNRIKSYISFLASDSLEGRRSGTKGEELAMNYLKDQYKSIGLEPADSNSFVQSFQFDEGKDYRTKNTFLYINDTDLEYGKDYFPLAFSGEKKVKSTTAMSLKESNEVWFIDVKDILDDNKSNPHFDIEAFIKEEAIKIASKGATAMLLYNSSKETDNILFNKNDSSAALTIPVIYINNEAYKRLFADEMATKQVDLSVGFTRKIRTIHNVIGFINNHAEHTVILGAHYDHLGYGEDKNALDTLHQIHNGADDNASGSAALLELAHLLKTNSCANNNYLIIHFSGEELGLLGSKYWLQHPTKNISSNYMINMDMIGRMSDSSHAITIGGYGTSPAWDSLFKTVRADFKIKFDSAGSGPSDHASFYRANIPVLFFFTGGHADYHKTTDDVEKINFTGEQNIVQFIYKLILSLNDKGKLSFTKTAEPANSGKSKFTVSLGIMPDYAFTGTGVRIEAISQGKLAEKIGLLAGDVLLQLGEQKFADVMGYMKTLSMFKKGDTTTLRISRNTEEKTFKIEF